MGDVCIMDIILKTVILVEFEQCDNLGHANTRVQYSEHVAIH